MAADIFEWAKERGTRFYNLTVTGDDAAERGLQATVCLPHLYVLLGARVLPCFVTNNSQWLLIGQHPGAH